MHPSDLPPPSAGFLVWHLAMRWRAELDRALAAHGLTSAQYAVLASLHALTTGGARPSQRELADFASLEPMYVSKLVTALERSGLVRRATHPDDSRAVQLEITAAGDAAVRAARAQVRAIDDDRLRVLGGPRSAESEALRASLERLLRDTEGRRDRLARPADAG
ncbi:MarR family transcriptional regulator [Nocardioides sp. YIM 152315]|uniref:MarR family winged helix-turn-helix transcriptional regulator n=1 Tax=Nocardioides sp. YIM 152315 TaxID=3031760 RepID=UPI0023DA96C6|nr:MarR family transcriptional regulator [Nocardioides sp. YIM 152315]MDF1602468.1 MarR family transcriptional regulator [Nocardioides sp. YIM 152315]